METRDGCRAHHDVGVCARERADGSTRLIVRARAGRGYSFYRLPAWIGMPAVRIAHAIMERRQLHGIASRVESRQETGDDGHRQFA